MRKIAPMKQVVLLILFTVLTCFSTTVIAQQFDVALSKTTVTTAPVKYGTPIPFNITIHNQGTDTITNVEIIDHFGDGFDFQMGLNSGWDLHPTILNAVTTTYTQMIPPNESRIVTVNLVAQPGDSRDDWINTAEVVDFTDRFGVSQEGADTDSSGDEDPENDAGGQVGSPADNVVTGDGTGAVGDGVAATDEDDHDRDTIQIFDLALTKVLDPITGYRYGDTLTFITTVYNQGNVSLTNVRVRDIVPEGYINPTDVNQAAGWTSDAANPIYTFAAIAPFTSETVELRLILGQSQADGNAWVNYAEVISARTITLAPLGNNLDADSEMASNTEEERSVGQGDPDDNNIGNTSTNPGDQDDHDPAEPRVFDLALIKERATALSSFNYGTPIDYTFSVINQGNVSASNIVIRDSVPCGAMFEQALNPDWSYDPITHIATFTVPTTLEPLAAGSTNHIYQGDLILTVISCFEDPATAWTNYMEILEATTDEGVETEEIDGVFDANMTNDAGGVPLTDTDNALNGMGVVDEDNHDVELLQVYDLALKKTLVTEGPYTEGQDLEFMIRVYNQGNVVIEDLVIEDFVQGGFGYDQATNTPLGWTTSYSTLVGGVPTVFPDTLNVMENIFLQTGDSTDISIILTLELDERTLEDWYNFAHVWVATDTVGNNRFDDADSNPFTPTSAEFAVVPGSAEDDDIFSPGKAAMPAVEEDDHDVANINFFDLALSKTLTSSPSAYGQLATYDIVIANEGVQFAHDVTITDYLPCGLTFDSADNPGWIENPVTGNPEFFYTDTIWPGESALVTLSLSVDECITPDADAYRNVAEISNALNDDDVTGDDQDSTPDADPDNPAEDDQDDALLEVFDLSLTKEVLTPPASFVVGSTVTYNITVTNEGNIEAFNTQITDYLPCGLAFDPGSNSGWSIDLISGFPTFTITDGIAPGTSVTVPLTLSIADCGAGVALDITNVAEISNDEGPDNAEVDDFDSMPDIVSDNDNPDEDDIDSAVLDFFDLSLEKTLITDIAELTYGQDLTYEIKVKNEGSVEATSFTVTDYLACGLGFSANNGWSIDPISGYPTNTVMSPLAAGDSTTLILVLTLEECATPTASAWGNVAEISSANDADGPADDEDSIADDDPENDPVGEDDIDDAPLAVGDLALDKAHIQPADPIAVGTAIDYTITVTNQGNVEMTSFVVTDYLPCALDFTTIGNPGWTVNVTTGDLEYTVSTLGIGESLDIPLRLTVGNCTDDTDTAPFSNIAEVSDTGDNPDDPDSTPDDDPENDEEGEDDHDEDTLEFFDLSLEKTSTLPADLVYGTVIPYVITVTNEGSLPATDVEVTDYIPCGLRFDPAQNVGLNWIQDIVTGFVSTTFEGTIASGGSHDFVLNLIIEPCTGDLTTAYNNVAEISDDTPGDDTDSTPDDIPDNDSVGEDDIDNDEIDVFDLSLTKSTASTQTEYEQGQQVTFDIVVTNEGNVPASNFEVVDYAACGLAYVAGGAIPWMEDPSGNLRYTYAGTLNPGQSQSFAITFQVVACSGSTSRTNIAEITANGGGEQDADSTPDDNPVNDPVGEDDTDSSTISVIVNEASIGDLVFVDTDGDGIQDPGEMGMPDVMVILYTPSGAIIAVTQTDANGAYQFDDVMPSDYYIEFVIEGDFVPSPANEGTDPANDSNVTGDNGPNTTSTFTILAGETNETIDAGFFVCSEIKGVTYYDVNEDDVRQSTENGINGLVVNLYRRVGGQNILVDSETTHHDYDTPSDDGIWDFCVAPGQYFIEVVMPPIGLVRVRPFIGGVNFDSDINGANGPNTTPTFTLAPGGSKTDLGAGYYPMATVGNRVWYDENHNGIQDIEEPKAAGITVQVFDMSHQLVDEVQTDAEGTYEVEYLRKEEYYLKFEAPEGYGFTFADATSDDSMDSDVNHVMGANTTSPRLFDPGDHVLNIDAGLVSGVLPLQWGDIDVISRDDHHAVQWSTLQELNVKEFVVQRRLESEDKFYDIGRVTAVGNSTETEKYEFIDKDVAANGRYLYRLQQIDIDGANSFSSIVQVQRMADLDIKIYPNPASVQIMISGLPDEEGQYFLSLSDELGRLLISREYSYDETVDISDLANGVYTISIVSEGQVIHQDRLIKIE